MGTSAIVSTIKVKNNILVDIHENKFQNSLYGDMNDLVQNFKVM